ncbi:hypothetical protein K2X33_01080 [bacterium]|nr:hypothetical protein [bacterium]
MRVLTLLALLLGSYVHGESAEKRLLQSAKPRVNYPAGELAFEKFLPLCLFVELGAGSAEQLGDGLMREAAGCGIYLKLAVRYVSGVPNQPSLLPQLLRNVRERCDALNAFRDLGVDKASAAIVVRDPRLARAQCDVPADSDQLSCGEYAVPPEGSILSRMASTGQGGKVAPKGQPAVSVISAGDHALRDIHTWAFGIALLGMPRGEGLGMGVGLPDEGYAGAGAGNEMGWKPAGCVALRAAAFANAKDWRYQERKPLTGWDSRLLDLASDEKLFTAKPVASDTPAPDAPVSKRRARAAEGARRSGSNRAGEAAEEAPASPSSVSLPPLPDGANRGTSSSGFPGAVVPGAVGLPGGSNPSGAGTGASFDQDFFRSPSPPSTDAPSSAPPKGGAKHGK